MAAPTESPSLSNLARSKLHLSVSSKDKDRCSLHRWVLLKNSIIRSNPVVPPNTPTSEHAETRHTSLPEESDFHDEEPCLDDETDSFMFPDVGKFGPAEEVNTSEAQWLDSLLETLGDDDEDDFGTDVDVSVIPVEDEEDHLLSPLASPMSSSDDLQAYFSPTPVPPQYSLPFPYREQLLLSYSPFDSSFQSSLASIPPPYDDPLPYYDQDDIETLSVPDAIEDTSDDESETPPTPLMGRSSSSMSLSDAASIPLPAERSRLRRAQPHVYIDSEDAYFYPFELDPLPFPRNHHSSYNTYQEC